jgi:DNA-binding MarR family transcriptional regulator
MKVHEFIKVMEFIRKEFGRKYAPQQLSFLMLVSLRGGITHNEIALKLQMPQASVSRNVTKLASGTTGYSGVGYGLVENRPDEVFDSRRNAVWLTPNGEEFVAKIKKMIG